MRRTLPIAVLALLPLAGPAVAADPAPTAAPSPASAPAAPAAAPAANPADVSSPDAILAALYDVISGPAGKKRDWARMKSLFHEGARLIPSGARPSGEVGARVLDVNGYIERSSPFFEKDGFYEREVARHMDRFGHIAQVFSTYEARHDPKGEPFLRGINSIQLLDDGKRWWIVTVYWEPESDHVKIPAEFAKSRTE